MISKKEFFYRYKLTIANPSGLRACQIAREIEDLNPAIVRNVLDEGQETNALYLNEGSYAEQDVLAHQLKSLNVVSGTIKNLQTGDYTEFPAHSGFLYFPDSLASERIRENIKITDMIRNILFAFWTVGTIALIVSLAANSNFPNDSSSLCDQRCPGQTPCGFKNRYCCDAQ